MSQATLEKAGRFTREGRVEVTFATEEDLWSAVVEGDTDTYYVWSEPGDRGCECPSGAKRHKCSHFLAAEAAVFGELAGRSGA